MEKYTWIVNDIIYTNEYFINYKQCRFQAFQEFYNKVFMGNVKILNKKGRIIEHFILNKYHKSFYQNNEQYYERYEQLSLFENYENKN
jgi:hypothetical protein